MPNILGIKARTPVNLAIVKLHKAAATVNAPRLRSAAAEGIVFIYALVFNHDLLLRFLYYWSLSLSLIFIDSVVIIPPESLSE